MAGLMLPGNGDRNRIRGPAQHRCPQVSTSTLRSLCTNALTAGSLAPGQGLRSRPATENNNNRNNNDNSKRNNNNNNNNLGNGSGVARAYAVGIAGQNQTTTLEGPTHLDLGYER
ncbi:hypothetical protein Tco_0452168 [Tanacetum coccineum]